MRREKLFYTERTKTSQFLTGIKKSALLILLPLLILAVVIPALLSTFFGKDIPMFDDSDLILSDISIPEEENAYFDLRKIEQVHEYNGGKSEILKSILEGFYWDESKVNEALMKNKENLENFDKAVSKNKFSVEPRVEISPGIFKNPPVGTWRSIAKIASLRVLKLARNDQADLAIYEATKIIKLGALIEGSRGNTFELLAGTEIKEEGIRIFSLVVLENDLSYDNLKRHLKIIDKFNLDKNNSFNKIMYRDFKESVRGIQNTSLVSYFKESHNSWRGNYFSIGEYYYFNNFYFKPNKTLKLYADKRRETINYFNESCSVPELKEDFGHLLTSISAIPKIYITENVLGILQSETGIEVLNILKKARCDSQLSINALKIKIATKLYFMDNNSYPEDLNKLVPHYLQIVPKDVYTEKQFKYDYNNKMLYSESIPQQSRKIKSIYDLKFRNIEEDLDDDREVMQL